MRKALKKLKSDSGASLMMALLLFLVCAVIGSAVLVAGTAASGRMAKIAEMDRRYYSVNSAANLLVDLYSEPVTIEKDPATGKTKVNDVDYDPTKAEFNSLPLETAYRIFARPEGSTDSIKLTLKLNGLPEGAEKIEVTETIKPDNSLEFAIKNKVESTDTNKDVYELHLTFGVEDPANRTKIQWKLLDISRVSNA